MGSEVEKIRASQGEEVYNARDLLAQLRRVLERCRDREEARQLDAQIRQMHGPFSRRFGFGARQMKRRS
jgi:hypothetical protein